MTYTPNVPQANQTIAATTNPIRNNFTYLDTILRKQHSFNGNSPGVDLGAHLFTAMPNMSDPVSNPTGCDGTYYVSGNKPKFFDGANSWKIQYTGLFQLATTGLSALTTSLSNIITLPANSCGTYFLIPPGGTASQAASAMGQFVTGATDLQIGAVSDPGISLTTSGLTLRGQTTSSGLNGNYRYVVIYFTP